MIPAHHHAQQGREPMPPPKVLFSPQTHTTSLSEENEENSHRTRSGHSPSSSKLLSFSPQHEVHSVQNGPDADKTYRFHQESERTHDSVNKIKRAKPSQRITRNRRITSCLQCRERKQKCDRMRPVCGNCTTNTVRGGLCTYIDTTDGVQEVLASETEKNAKRVKRSPEDVGNKRALHSASINPRASHSLSTITSRRLSLITATAWAGKDQSLDFDTRVRYARAAAIGTVLFGTPTSMNQTTTSYTPLAAVDTLRLPTAKDLGEFLDTYQMNVEWMVNVVVTDLNRSRFENFLNWWHSEPQTLPADPPLIPLMLTILALALQARRMEPHCVLKRQEQQSKNESEPDSARTRWSRPKSPDVKFLSNCSSERELLETAGRCIDALQIACPSNWASAFSAPLDLVRASLLRGIWHMSELHLQFAGSCFGTSMRLAHAAALNHDTRHWPSIGKEEAQARRNIYWNVIMFEMMHAQRVVQPSTVLLSSFDTQFPDDYDALMNLFRRSGLIEPFIVDGRRSNIRVHPISRVSFDFYTSRFKWTHVLIHGQNGAYSDNKSAFAEKYEAWKRDLPQNLKDVLNTDVLETGKYYSSGGGNGAGLESQHREQRIQYLQRCLLQMTNLSTNIQVHRPQLDQTGQWRPPEGHAQRSLELCLESAQKLILLIHLIVTQDPGPPFCLYHLLIFQCFQAAIVIAIQSAICRLGSNLHLAQFVQQARPSLDMALQTLDMVAKQGGLRYVAEQASRYADTLRNVDDAQTLRGKQRPEKKGVSESFNATEGVHRTAMGVPPQVVPEGDGSRLGGQGYPSGSSKLQSSAGNEREVYLPKEVDALNTLDATPMESRIQPDNATVDRIQPDNATVDRSTPIQGLNAFGLFEPKPFGIGFNELTVMDSSLLGRNQILGDRPAPSIFYGGRFDRSFDSSTHAQEVSSVPLHVHQTEQVHPISQTWQDPFYLSQRTTANKAHEEGSSTLKTNQEESPTVRKALEDSQLSMYQENQVPNQNTWQRDPNHIMSSESSVARHDLNAWQNAQVPTLDSLGDSFAMEWSEWERTVEKLLYAER